MTEEQLEDKRKPAQQIANAFAVMRADIQAKRSGAMPVGTLEALAGDVLALIAEVRRLRKALQAAEDQHLASCICLSSQLPCDCGKAERDAALGG